MSKLILKSSKLHSLNDSENVDLGVYNLDLAQFKLPKAMVVQKEGTSSRVVKEKNSVGELVETGKYNLFFEVYDRAFIEIILNNGGTEIGSPTTIVIEGQDSLPILDNYEDGEFIPITFTNLNVRPKKVQKKIFVGQGKPMAESWIYADIKVVADSYVTGDVNEPKAK
ncbi:peptidase [Brochothrix thermosphacta]|uniref:peptidase n=1 Tax=Brochothrix thermosphacta TaxID=2756 RepID=UPI00083F5580|nr:peptidase [Brochothrix thermosphacta]ODJ72296.1 peptidase [Brochothrix thermosphacta]SPN75311.1 Peptidase [Brochothrix thermosphacta]